LLLCLPPLALAAATLYPLARGNLGRPEQQQLTEPWPLTALDPDADEVRWTVRRHEAKRQVTCALIDGRLTLRQAAAQFRDINADSPDTARHWRQSEYTAEEWPYRQVIAFVQVEFEVNRRAPAQAQAWVARLEAEMREHLRRDSGPRLQPRPGATGRPGR
jgi:hypothetical protein